MLHMDAYETVLESFENYANNTPDVNGDCEADGAAYITNGDVWWHEMVRWTHDDDGTHLTVLCTVSERSGRCCDRGDYGYAVAWPVLLCNPDAYGDEKSSWRVEDSSWVEVTRESARACTYSHAGRFSYQPESDPIYLLGDPEGVVWGKGDDDPCEPLYQREYLAWVNVNDLEDEVIHKLATFVEGAGTNFEDDGEDEILAAIADHEVNYYSERD